MKIQNIIKVILLVSFFALSVEAQTPTKIVLSPLEVTLSPGQHQQVTATVYDENNQVIPGAKISWLPPLGVTSCVHVDRGMLIGIVVGKCGVNVLLPIGTISALTAEKPIQVTVIPSSVISEHIKVEVLGKTIYEQDSILAAIGEQGYGTCWVFMQARYFNCFRDPKSMIRYEWARWLFPNGQDLRDAQAAQVASEGYSNVFVWAGQLRASRPKQ